MFKLFVRMLKLFAALSSMLRHSYFDGPTKYYFQICILFT